ncbi:tumor necrosis factor receptor superfamily member 12A [Protopterus annectens]|uniref:tumor necrosis factor receptor superfamily member 12A n=1 Tax=Protopterus annectens TaxID=7888 RepID=UPI001CFA19D9|nr:tumor necrosis factor receptor superfamily member 12A [Protopterus annectens]
MDLKVSCFLLFLIHFVLSEHDILGSKCSSTQSWSDDLEKCMDCANCVMKPFNDFCKSCKDGPSVVQTMPVWQIVTLATVTSVILICVITLAVFLAKRKKQAKYATPIEETGGNEHDLLHGRGTA